jgi:hypothetical protein
MNTSRSRLLSAVLVALLAAWLQGCAQPKVQVRVDPQQNPWTHLQPNNNPRNFQFALVSDRTGGVRPGIFEDAVRKLNLLQPEFVVSVGDLIMGKTEDRQKIDAEWQEFMGFVDRLQMPFFYLPGNHDITNPVMEEEWIKRFGRLYYHFVYQDVLFLCLDSEDPPPTHMSEAQQTYVRRALAENPNVRWTLVFMHKPLWDYAENTGWTAIEEMLKGRRHTVIAGHRHEYMKFTRNDQSYIVLATTGGGSGMRGRAFGEFDQVAWVTMTDQGPILANLLLEGIWDENIRTEEMAARMKSFLEGRALTGDPLFKDGKFKGEENFSSTTTKLRLANDADTPVKFHARFNSTDQVHIKPAQVEKELAPNTVELITVEFVVAAPVPVKELTPLTADWTMEFPGEPPLKISGQHHWEEQKK